MYKQVKLLCKQGPIYIKMKGELNCFICDDNGKSSVEDDLPGKFCCVFKFKVVLKLGCYQEQYMANIMQFKEYQSPF